MIPLKIVVCFVFAVVIIAGLNRVYTVPISMYQRRQETKESRDEDDHDGQEDEDEDDSIPNFKDRAREAFTNAFPAISGRRKKGKSYQ